jgi:hypothetical protein
MDKQRAAVQGNGRLAGIHNQAPAANYRMSAHCFKPGIIPVRKATVRGEILPAQGREASDVSGAWRRGRTVDLRAA